MELIASVRGRLRRRGWRSLVKYSTLRFWSVRQMMVRLRRMRSSGAGRTLPTGTDTQFQRHSRLFVVRQLRERGYYAGLRLPADTVTSMQAYARSAMLEAWFGRTPIRFSLSQRDDVEQHFGSPIIIAQGIKPRTFTPIRSLAADPLLHRIAADYLGYAPSTVHYTLKWSFACDASAEERLAAKQTIRFHYDLHAARSIAVYFYLTDVSRHHGAHQLVVGSHGPKTLGETLSRTGKSKQYIEQKFGADKILTLTGGAGFGFIADQYCYHRATIPVSDDRLLLRLELS